MDSYERLVDFAEHFGLEVIEKSFKSSAKGLCKGNKIGISNSIENKNEKRCILAEEIAHSFYTVGDILDTRNLLCMKQELHARRAAFEAILPVSLLIESYNKGNFSCYEMSEDLDVTEDFLMETINYYAVKYGSYLRQGKYLISFSPFHVIDRSGRTEGVV